MLQLCSRIIPPLLILAIIVGGCGANQTASPTTNVPTRTGPGSIRVFVFDDLNSNGQADTNEPGVTDTIGFGKGAGSPPCGRAGTFTRITTQADGKYVFTNLPPDTYCVYYFGDHPLTSPVPPPINLKAGEERSVVIAIKANQ